MKRNVEKKNEINFKMYEKDTTIFQQTSWLSREKVQTRDLSQGACFVSE